MSASDKDYEDASEYLVELAKAQGVAVSSVSDGTIFLFSKQHLQNVMAQNPGEMVVIFVKKPNPKMAS